MMRTALDGDDMRIGIYEKALSLQMSWPERLSAAAEAGFDFFEIAIDESHERLGRLVWPPKERAVLRNAVADSGVPILTIVLSAHRKIPLGSASLTIRQQALDIMRQAIEFAVDVGISVIQLAGYFVYYESHAGGARERFADGLHQAATWASQAGVILGLENVDGHDIISISDAMQFVTALNSPWFQLYPDLGNLSANELDVCAELEAAQGHIVGLHLKDTRPGEFRRVPFGGGTVPFIEAFRTLVRMNYTGPMALEMWNDDAINSQQIISEAREWVIKQMIEGGLTDLHRPLGLGVHS